MSKTIDELLKAKEEARQRILTAIGIETEKFHKENGISIRYISVSMDEVTAFGDKLAVYIISDVDLELSL